MKTSVESPFYRNNPAAYAACFPVRAPLWHWRCSEPSSRSRSTPSGPRGTECISASGTRQIVDAEQRRDAADPDGPTISHPPHLVGTRGASGNQRPGRHGQPSRQCEMSTTANCRDIHVLSVASRRAEPITRLCPAKSAIDTIAGANRRGERWFDSRIAASWAMQSNTVLAAPNVPR